MCFLNEKNQKKGKKCHWSKNYSKNHFQFLKYCTGFDIFTNRKEKNMNNKLQKLAAKALTGVLSRKLHMEANAASSIFIHQPKVPENLSRFKEKK